VLGTTGVATQARRTARRSQKPSAIDAQADRRSHRRCDLLLRIGFRNTVKLLTATLESAGFKVERGVADMPTAYRATYGSGSPVIGLMADYDCVPGASQKPAVLTHTPLVEGAPGHGEGHNTNPPTVLGAALALKQVIDQKVGCRRYGGPAEGWAPAAATWSMRDCSRVSTP
jgi:aminobenzoyl-glutamate utilization protein B